MKITDVLHRYGNENEYGKPVPRLLTPRDGCKGTVWRDIGVFAL